MIFRSYEHALRLPCKCRASFHLENVFETAECPCWRTPPPFAIRQYRPRRPANWPQLL